MSLKRLLVYPFQLYLFCLFPGSLFGERTRSFVCPVVFHDLDCAFACPPCGWTSAYIHSLIRITKWYNAILSILFLPLLFSHFCFSTHCISWGLVLMWKAGGMLFFCFLTSLHNTDLVSEPVSWKRGYLFFSCSWRKEVLNNKIQLSIF